MKIIALSRLGFREFRRELRALFPIILALTVGTAALFGVLSSIRIMREVLDREAREIIGGDIEVNVDFPPPEPVIKFLQAAQEGGTLEFAPVSETNSVVSTRDEVSRSLLTEVKVVSAKYPLYGAFLVGSGAPAEALSENQVLVEPALLERLGLKRGDALRIGKDDFTIVDTVASEPDRTLSFSILGPRIFLSEEGFAKTGLFIAGSRLDYRIDIKVPKAEEVRPLAGELKELLKGTTGRVGIAEDGPPQMERLIQNLQKFFVSVALVTVFLSGIAIAITMTGYLQRKKRTLAIWKCLGMTDAEGVGAFIVQALCAGACGGILGGISGNFLPLVLGHLLSGFLTFQLPLSFSWSELGAAVLFGIGTVLLSTFFPLLSIRGVQPLALFHPFSTGRKRSFFQKTGLSLLVIPIFAWGIIFFFVRNFFWGTMVLGGILAALAFLAVVFWLLFGWLQKRRQGFRALSVRTVFSLLARYRWRRILLMAALTLSIGMILLVLLLRDTLNSGLIRTANQENGANVALIDVQRDQVNGVEALLPEKAAFYPRISARIFALDGKQINRNDRTLPLEMTREFNLTYRDELIAGEKIVSGKFWSKDDTADEVSVDRATAENFGIVLGSIITFDIQGVQRDFTVTSLREVERNLTQPFFFFLMPRKSLEDAPQTLFGLLRVRSGEIPALQNRIAERFPNVLAIDVGQIVATVEKIDSQAVDVLLFFGTFIFLSGIFLLLGMVQSTARERRRDIVLMKILGAEQRFLRELVLLEFGLYALAAGGFGFLLAATGAWILNAQLFQDAGVTVSGEAGAFLFVLMAGVILAGWIQSYALLRHSPRELLQEGGR